MVTEQMFADGLVCEGIRGLMAKRGASRAYFVANGKTATFFDSCDGLQERINIRASEIPLEQHELLLKSLVVEYRIIHGDSASNVYITPNARSIFEFEAGVSKRLQAIESRIDDAEKEIAAAAREREMFRRDLDEIDAEISDLQEQTGLANVESVQDDLFFLAGVYPTGLVCIKGKDAESVVLECRSLFPNAQDILVEQVTEEEYNAMFDRFHVLSS